MKKEDYEKLNYYLNGCFQELEKNDSFLLRNILPISKLINDFAFLTNQYEFKNDTKSNHLTYQDIYLLAREIIESIDKGYLVYYDDLIKSGKLDFSYNHDYPCSQFVFGIDADVKLININREFNYIDVSTLVHEFMHYMNCLIGPITINRYLLTEFISIYFEEYAKIYLLKKGVPKEELMFNERIIYTRCIANDFNSYALIFLVYEKIGNIDENSWKFLYQNYVDISKEIFEEECKELLVKLQEIEETYKMEIMFERNFNEKELFMKQVTLFNSDYRYILGTILAYDTLEYNKFEQMVYLCNHINDEKYSEMNLLNVLETIDIDIDQIDLKTVEKIIIHNNKKKVK